MKSKHLPLLGLVGALAVLAWLAISPYVSRSPKDNPSFSAGQMKSESTMSSGRTFVSSGNPTFNRDHIVILTNHAPHPLLRHLHVLLAKGLQDSGAIERVEFASMPDAGSAEPDLFLRIELKDLKEEGLLNRSAKSLVTASLASVPWQSSHFQSDATSTPQLQFGWNATLNHQCTFSGISSDRYREIARSLSESLLKDLVKQVNQLSTDFPQMPKLPTELYGPYQPVKDFSFLKELKAQRVHSSFGLLKHNDTFWTFKLDPLAQLPKIAEQLQTENWRVDSTTLTNTVEAHIRLSRNDEVLEIFQENSEQPDLNGTKQNASRHDFVAHYRKTFSQAEREAALEKLFTANPSLELLTPFEHSFSPKQHQRYAALLEQSPPTSLRQCLRLAERYWERKDTNAALKMLLRTKALQSTLDSSTLNFEIEALAKKISPKMKLTLEPEPEVYRDLGFLEIADGAQTLKLERPLGEPLWLFAPSEGGVQTFCLILNKPKEGTYPWKIIGTKGGARSSTSGNSKLSAQGRWQQIFSFGKRSLQFIAFPSPEENQVRYTIETN